MSLSNDADFFHRRYLARIAGAILLTTIPLASFAEFAVKEKALFPGDPDGTAIQIRSMETQFRLAFLCDICLVIIELLMVSIFHELFRDVSSTLSFAAVYLRILMLFAALIKAIFHFGALFCVLQKQDSLGELAFGLLQAGAIPASVSLLALSCHCTVLGILMIQSRWFPTLLGAGQLIAAVGYFVNGLCPIAFPQLTGLARSVVVPLSLPGDPTLCIYLLWRGVRRMDEEEKQKEF